MTWCCYHQRLKDCKKLFDVCARYADAHDIAFNVKKTVCMAILPRLFKSMSLPDIVLNGLVLYSLSLSLSLSLALSLSLSLCLSKIIVFPCIAGMFLVFVCAILIVFLYCVNLRV